MKVDFIIDGAAAPAASGAPEAWQQRSARS
jgi:hypothetical protein